MELLIAIILQILEGLGVYSTYSNRPTKKLNKFLAIIFLSTIFLIILAALLKKF
jgi:hypothetical protein